MLLASALPRFCRPPRLTLGPLPQGPRPVGADNTASMPRHRRNSQGRKLLVAGRDNRTNRERSNVDEFIKNLGSGYWWISVVVVGLLINLVSAYLKTPLDGFMVRTWGWWRDRSAKRRERFERHASALSNDPHRQLIYLGMEMRGRMQSAQFWLMALMLISFAIYLRAPLEAEATQLLRRLSFATAMVSGIFGVVAYNRALEIESLIARARKLALERSQ